MTDMDKKEFVLHCNGLWLDEDQPKTIDSYVHGESKIVRNINKQDLCYKDLDKLFHDVFLKTEDIKLNIEYITTGKLWPLRNDIEVMEMWLMMDMARDYRYHLFAIFEEVPTECSATGST